MLEKALTGSNRYWGWIAVLLAFMAAGALSYVQQYNYGLGLTGMSRDVSWGVYIAQFTFLVGVAASGVMVVLPYYLHNYKTFGKITILGEFLAVAAVSMCLLFILADLGQPLRALNVLLHPTPNSILFWDMIVLNVYLFLNIFVGWVVLNAEKKEVAPPKWIKPFIYISIPWAVSIHTVTAFLYAGLPGRHFWLTAILAPRFLASAFAGGPALLILLCLIIKRVTKFDAGQEAIQKLVTIVTYAALINVFFVLLEFFTAYYSNIPGHMHTLDYLFFGLHGQGQLVPWMRVSTIFGIIAIVMFLVPATRKREDTLAIACVLLFISLWIDKGIGLVIGGFVPSPLEEITAYHPSFQEIMITLGVWATGFFILTVLYKIALSVKEEKMIS
ncbi:MAG: polysulfide reductase NrfD [Desulfobulbaceae bacterium]|jgi:molybdopterin-containing oxidoreductase family membrane subunit|nr:polysulfide reductase NrfD [Desulfobulbaceae bacterium]HKJ15413.1 NrfD/PsrC family molybdoenzyme membrane anchor subunit [Desulfobulbales bacterium]MDH3542055.1 polysulfide reductase NrfD [Desulfobulbaceae bacterium]MDH3775500.1 polysulfide reductase NrfD [Desulfobulbaceae bacterium]MDH3781445.1 polysulfide reductase NrfD [Desulfobulbaceae bacterium]